MQEFLEINFSKYGGVALHLTVEARKLSKTVNFELIFDRINMIYRILFDIKRKILLIL